jgi:hypothetical protein
LLFGVLLRGGDDQSRRWQRDQAGVLCVVTCVHCAEEIETGEAHPELPEFHRECAVRAIAGSAAHQLGDCSCCGGDRADPPGMSLRASAKLAYDTYLVLHPKG